jgi:hypothetical protein
VGKYIGFDLFVRDVLECAEVNDEGFDIVAEPEKISVVSLCLCGILELEVATHRRI